MSTPLTRTYITAKDKRHEPFDIAIAQRPRTVPGKDTIVFFHGLGCSKTMWEPILEMADEMDARSHPYNLVAVDLPGHGETPPSVHMPMLGFEGDSYGWIAWQLAMEHVLSALVATGPVHMVAHSASVPVLVALVHDLNQYGTDAVFTNLGTIISVEGNHTAGDCALISRRIAEQRIEDYVTTGHDRIGKELSDQGLVHTIAWARQWATADPSDVHDLAATLAYMGETDYQILAQRWLDHPHRAYLWGTESTLPAATMDLMTTIYPQIPTFRRSIQDANHFPMIISPVQTLEAVMDAVTYFDKD